MVSPLSIRALRKQRCAWLANIETTVRPRCVVAVVLIYKMALPSLSPLSLFSPFHLSLSPFTSVSHLSPQSLTFHLSLSPFSAIIHFHTMVVGHHRCSFKFEIRCR